MLWYAKYPFTTSLESYAKRELGYYGSIEELLSDEEARRLAQARLEASLSQDGLPSMIGSTEWEEVLSFHAALAATALSGSLRLLRRLADAEAYRVKRLLSKEDMKSLLRLSRILGLNASLENLVINWLYSKRRKNVLPRLLQFSIPLPSYLRTASRLEDRKWRLTNSFLLSGKVYMDRESFEDFICASISERIADLAENYRDLEIPMLRDLGTRIASRLDSYYGPGPFDPSKLPACIKEIISSAREGDLNSEKLYMLVTFLARINAPTEYLEEIIYSTGMVPRAVARVMAESLLEEAKQFRPYKCEVAVSKGVCSECKDNILTEYWRAIRRGRDRS